MKKIFSLLVFLFLTIGISNAAYNLSDFSMKLYKNGYLYQGPFTSEGQCSSFKNYRNEKSSNTGLRSECFQLELDKKYYYFICRNGNSCSKTTILNTVGYKELYSTSSLGTTSSLSSSDNECLSNINVSKYSKLSDKIRGQLIMISDKIENIYSEKNDLIKSLELGYYDYKLLSKREALSKKQGSESIVQVIDFFHDYTSCKIDSLQGSQDTGDDELSGFLGDTFGDILNEGGNNSESNKTELSNYLTTKVSGLTGNKKEEFISYVKNYDKINDVTKKFISNYDGEGDIVITPEVPCPVYSIAGCEIGYTSKLIRTETLSNGCKKPVYECVSNGGDNDGNTGLYNFVAGSKEACENSISLRWAGKTTTCSIGGGCGVYCGKPSSACKSANPSLYGACIYPNEAVDITPTSTTPTSTTPTSTTPTSTTPTSTTPTSVTNTDISVSKTSVKPGESVTVAYSVSDEFTNCMVSYSKGNGGGSSTFTVKQNGINTSYSMVFADSGYIMLECNKNKRYISLNGGNDFTKKIDIIVSDSYKCIEKKIGNYNLPSKVFGTKTSAKYVSDIRGGKITYTSWYECKNGSWDRLENTREQLSIECNEGWFKQDNGCIEFTNQNVKKTYDVAQKSTYTCSTYQGDIKFTYSYGSDPKTDGLYFKTSSNPFGSGIRYALYIGSGKGLNGNLPTSITRQIGNTYDCNGTKKAGVTTDECKASYTCTLDGSNTTPTTPTTPTLNSRQQTIITLYKSLFNRIVTISDSGVKYWDSSSVSTSNLEQALINGATGNDRETVCSKGKKPDRLWFCYSDVNAYINQVGKTNFEGIKKTILDAEKKGYQSSYLREQVAKVLGVSKSDVDNYVNGNTANSCKRELVQLTKTKNFDSNSMAWLNESTDTVQWKCRDDHNGVRYSPDYKTKGIKGSKYSTGCTGTKKWWTEKWYNLVSGDPSICKNQ